jgi:uncharacterized protein CbrC (UPF0167 family)
LEYKIYSFNGTDYTDISQYAVSYPDIPLRVERNSDFSLIIKPLQIDFVNDMSSALRAADLILAIEKDGVKFAYYVIQTATQDIETEVWTVSARHILDTMKDEDLTDYINSTNVTSTNTNTGYYENTATPGVTQEIVLKALPAHKCLEYAIENFSDIFDTCTFDFETPANQVTFETYFCLERAVAKFKSENNATLWDWFNQTVRAFAFGVYFEDNKIILRRHTVTTTPATHNAGVAHNYADEFYNSQEFNIRQKAGEFQVAIVNDEYLRDLTYYGTASNTLMQFPNYIQGTLNKAGWMQRMYIDTPQKTGLGSVYNEVNLITQNIDDVTKIDFEINDTYEYFRGMFNNPPASRFLNLSETSYIISKSAQGMPRVEKTSNVILDITETAVGTGIAKAKFVIVSAGAARKHELSKACFVTIAAGAYAGVYYSTQEVNTDKFYTIINANEIRLWGVSYGSDDLNRAATKTQNAIIKKIDRSTPGTNDWTIELYKDTAESFYPSAGEVVTITNCNHTSKTTGLVTEFDGDYAFWDGVTHGVDEWKLDVPNIIIKKSFGAVYGYGGYRFINDDSVAKVTKPQATKNTKQIAFPKHFFFYTGTSTTGGLMYRVSNAYPVDTTNSFRFHLSGANTWANTLIEENINVDDEITVDDANVESIDINVFDRSVAIKQTRIDT